MNNGNTNTNTNNHTNIIHKLTMGIFNIFLGIATEVPLWFLNGIALNLGIGTRSKPLSDMSPVEVTSGFINLTKMLTDPAIRNQIFAIIGTASPIVKEVMMNIVNIALDVGKGAASETIAFICHDTPAAPLCGISTMVENLEKFVKDSTHDIEQLLSTTADAKTQLMTISNQLHNIKNSVPSINPTNINPASINPASIIKGGGGHIHTMINEKQKIKNRIHNSISRFLSANNNKLKIKSKTKLKTKTKTKRRMNNK
jgi:hypothetical protein